MWEKATLLAGALMCVALAGCTDNPVDLRGNLLPDEVRGVSNLSHRTINEGGGILQVDWSIEFEDGTLLDHGSDRLSPGDTHVIDRDLLSDYALVYKHQTTIADEPRSGGGVLEIRLYPPDCQRTVAEFIDRVEIKDEIDLHTFNEGRGC